MTPEFALDPSKAGELIKIEQSISLRTALDGQSVASLMRQSQGKTIKMIMALAFRYQQQVTTFEKLSEEQMILLASDVADLFRGETLEDIVLCFKMARQGAFGYHSRFDIVVVASWVPKYKQLKAEKREQLHEQQKGQFRQSTNQMGQHMPREALEKFQELSQTLKANRAARKQQQTKPKTKHALNDLSVFLEQLPYTCKTLSPQDLQSQYQKAHNQGKQEIAQIYLHEIQQRAKKKK